MNRSLLEAKVRQVTGDDVDLCLRVPAVVLMSQTRNGAPYTLYSGKQDLVGSAPFNENTVIWIASVTKLMTTVAAMQCVERKLIALDTDVTEILPELHRVGFLEGFVGDVAKSKDFHETITLRQLLTHTSGIGYDILNPDLLRFRGGKPKAFCGELDTAFYDLPLVFEPGQGWQYGAGLDWVGILIERLVGVSLGEFLEQNIWKPLGMNSTTLHLERRPELKARLATVLIRTAEGSIEASPKPIYAQPARDDSGGAGAYSTPADVMKLLHALLSEDPKLLLSSTIDEMFRPQLENPQFLEETLRNPTYRMGMTSYVPEGTPLNFGLGGLLCLSNLDSGRRAGSMQWGGYPNLSWWIDRVGNHCGLYASQLLPSRDQPSIDLKMEFERGVYALSD